MQAVVFEGFRRLAYQHAGIMLRENKEALVSARIAKRVRSLGLGSEHEYLSLLETDRSGTELLHFIDAISTNLTSFFREADHFQLLAHEVQRWLAEGKQRIRVWCAASSTGEEPYSLAMTLSEAVRGRDIDYGILASDISVRALQFAQRGCYEQAHLQIPVALRQKYFERDPRSTQSEPLLQVEAALRSKLVWKRINLATPPFPLHGGLDAIFCRNVMIYFDTPVRQRLISDLERLLRPGGLLIVAHSETLSGVQSGLQAVKPSVYRKRAR
jgi:chemotaxis protein methyltransferase CheR